MTPPNQPPAPNHTPRAHRLLALAAFALALLGVGFAILAVFFPGALDTLYALAGPGHHTSLGDDGRLGAGIYGGLMAGWGVHAALSARGVPLLQAFVAGALVWWVVDSAASILTGYPMNAVSNTGFLLLIAPAWLAGRRAPSGHAPSGR